MQPPNRFPPQPSFPRCQLEATPSTCPSFSPSNLPVVGIPNNPSNHNLQSRPYHCTQASPLQSTPISSLVTLALTPLHIPPSKPEIDCSIIVVYFISWSHVGHLYQIPVIDIRRNLKLEPFIILKSSQVEEQVQRAVVNEACPRCKNPQLEYYTKQLRSADEGQTVFYDCPKCAFKYSLNT